MSEITKSIELLIGSIEEESAKEEKMLSEKAKELKEEKLQNIQKSIMEKSLLEIQASQNDYAQKVNKKSAELSESHKAKLQSLRDKTAKAIIDETSRLLSDFVKSPEYISYLEKSAEKIRLYSEDSCVFLCSEKDLEAVKKIAAAYKNVVVKTDENIKLGGLKGQYNSLKVTLDDTLDSSFEDSKKDFIRSCGFGF